MKSSEPGVSFVESFCDHVLVSFMGIGLFKLSISTEVKFSVLHCPMNLLLFLIDLVKTNVVGVFF